MHASVAERQADGRARRKLVPRSSHADWSPGEDRADPVAVVQAANADRLQSLVPIRHGRMSTSAFAFYRGTADIMAADLAATPTSGLRAQICGDAHLANFGFYRSPDRRLVFDLNDFDETLPGPWEWDIKRLAASFAVCARHSGLGLSAAGRAARKATEAYRTAMHEFADLRTLDVWYARLEADEIVARLPEAMRKQGERQVGSWTGRDSIQASKKLTEEVDGARRIRSAPPELVPLRDIDDTEFDVTRDQMWSIVNDALDGYRRSLAPNRQVLIDRFDRLDVALKVVGVGSVGTRCWIVLFQGRDGDDPLFLQVKEAGRSVLEDHQPRSRFRHAGRRVVEGQQLMQASRDIFLGWTTGAAGRHFYVRQLRDGKGSIDTDRLNGTGIEGYADVCGHTLARAHARSGDPVAIAAYLGSGDAFDRAMAQFGEAYAEQAVQDHARFLEAIDAGRLAAALD